MTHPWLNVSLDDYEGHMRAAGVAQLEVLSDLFGEALTRCRPRSVAILGIAGGNGLEHIDTAVTNRVVGIDVNPRYLDTVRQRYARSAPLELYCIDLASEPPLILEPVDLVHAALLFEHAGTGRCLEHAVSLLAGGDSSLSVILQLPSDSSQAVGASPYASLQSLEGHFAFVDPAILQNTLQQQYGLRLWFETRRALPAGKAFWMGIFHGNTPCENKS